MCPGPDLFCGKMKIVERPQNKTKNQRDGAPKNPSIIQLINWARWSAQRMTKDAFNGISQWIGTEWHQKTSSSVVIDFISVVLFSRLLSFHLDWIWCLIPLNLCVFTVAFLSPSIAIRVIYTATKRLKNTHTTTRTWRKVDEINTKCDVNNLEAKSL